MKSNYPIFLKQAIKDYRFWIKFSLGLLQILSILIFITYNYIHLIKDSYTEHLLPGFYFIWVHLSYFTTLSNLFCGIFFFHSALNHHLEGKTKFNNDDVAKAVVIYVTLSLLIYHISETTRANSYQFNYFVDWISLIFEHSLGPIVAILYYFFLYNHQETKELKSFSQKYLWLILLVPICYGVFFWMLGELSQIGHGLGLYYWNGASKFGEGSHFVYPFLDFYHKPIFIKNISGAGEAVIMLLVLILFIVGIAYLYSWVVLSVRHYKWQDKLFIKIKKLK
ncbi:MAG: Pr6Pr family membrane protein [Spiroplasma sp.]